MFLVVMMLINIVISIVVVATMNTSKSFHRRRVDEASGDCDLDFSICSAKRFHCP